MTRKPSTSTEMVRRLTDVKSLIETLVEDVVASVKAIDPKHPWTQRTYVRSVFALVEGVLSGVSGYLLEGQSLGGWHLTDEERKAFWDAVPDPSVERPVGGRPTLTERTKLAFKAGRRIFGEHCSVDFGGTEFNAFQAALSLRHRLMHPKRQTDLELNDDDLRTVDSARDWFRFSAKKLFEAAVVELSDRLKRT
jgi:hypothetical protein